MDSILNFPVYNALVNAFQIPGNSSTTELAHAHDAVKSQLRDITILGNFLENQDLPRWRSFSTDPQSL